MSHPPKDKPTMMEVAVAFSVACAGPALIIWAATPIVRSLITTLFK